MLYSAHDGRTQAITQHQRCCSGCIKRKLKGEIKVAQLVGYVREHSAYHHGSITSKYGEYGPELRIKQRQPLDAIWSVRNAPHGEAGRRFTPLHLYQVGSYRPNHFSPGLTIDS
jgi:hypothetical protein